jgi:hypothetical protein
MAPRIISNSFTTMNALLLTGMLLATGCSAPVSEKGEKKKTGDSLKANGLPGKQGLTDADRAKKAADYLVLKDKILHKQKAFRKSYEGATSPEKKKKILQEARAYLLSTIASEMFPSWYGTTWDFNGTCTEPGNGSIACGYFVTTVIRDMGFVIPRTKWAQIASEELIKNITAKNNIKRYSSTPILKVESAISTWGKGLYIAGLDSHVGFILNYGDSIRFVHSNYYDAATGVCSQEFDSNNPLKDSGYRVIGKILDDDMVERWILSKALGN